MGVSFRGECIILTRMSEPVHRHGLTLATKVTLLRIAGIPVFVLLLVYYLLGLRDGTDNVNLRYGALAFFIVIAATDALDGYLARSRNEVTRVGKVLDPLADKSLLLAALILLTRPSMPQLSPHIPVWFTTLVISRDLVLFIGYLVIHHLVGHVEVHPRYSGKIATFFMMVVVCWVLLQDGEEVFRWLVITAGLFTGASMIQYFVDGARQLGKVAHH